MNVRRRCWRPLTVVIVALCMATPLSAADRPQHAILICTSDAASPAVRQAADGLAKEAGRVPVLKALIQTQGAGPILRRSSQEVLKDSDLAAYNHLIVIGLPCHDDLLRQIWEHYATVDESQQQVYMQGWGALAGDIGYIESDRNPFLHSRRIKQAPFETVLFKLSGTSELGVLTAVKAFQQDAVLNGLIPAGLVKRPRTTLLDLDPLVTKPTLNLPATLELTSTGTPWPLAGWTQVPANEYRAFIDAVGMEPVHVWRAKYLQPEVFKDVGVKGWMGGFHRMAFGNAVSLAEFVSADKAHQAAKTIGQGKGWTMMQLSGQPAWQAPQPTDEVMTESLGKVTAFSEGRFLVLSSLPDEVTKNLKQAIHPVTSSGSRR